jgi:hypothetical protein
MEDKNEQLKNLAEIRLLMERSSRFISLSGLSGISAGIIALIGAAAAFFYLGYDLRYTNWSAYLNLTEVRDDREKIWVLFALAAIILVFALAAGIFFTTRKARRNNLPIWDSTTRRLLFHVFVPLITGGIFCLILLYYRIYWLIAPATLLFYGLALLNGSKYTLSDVQYLGLSEIALGIISALLPGYGLIFWAVGFGVLHIIYGFIMYRKYERETSATA